MEGFSQGLKYLFWLAVLLIAVAYFTGSTSLLKTGFAGVNQLGLTFTGRDKSGKFGAYPTGG